MRPARIAVTVGDAVGMTLTPSWRDACPLDAICVVDGPFEGTCRHNSSSGLEILRVTAECAPEHAEVRLHWREYSGDVSPDMRIDVDRDAEGKITRFVRREDVPYSGDGFRPIAHDIARDVSGEVVQLSQCYASVDEPLCFCEVFSFAPPFGAFPTSVVTTDACTGAATITESFDYDESEPLRLRRRERDDDSDGNAELVVVYAYDDQGEVVAIDRVDEGLRTEVPIGNCCSAYENCGGDEIDLPALPTVQ